MSSLSTTPLPPIKWDWSPNLLIAISRLLFNRGKNAKGNVTNTTFPISPEQFLDEGKFGRRWVREQVSDVGGEGGGVIMRE